MPGTFGRLAADGARAVAANRCFLYVWRAGRRRGTVLRGCRRVGPNLDSRLDEFALAGKRIAWMREETASHGFLLQSELMVKAPGTHTREVASAYQEYGEGGLLWTLAGAGDTLAFGWTSQSADAEGVPVYEDQAYRLASWAAAPGAVACPAADGLLPSPPTPPWCVAAGTEESHVVAVAGGRILLGDLDGEGSLVEPDGAVHVVPLQQYRRGDALALTRERVLVLDSKKLWTYDLSGDAAGAWATGSRATALSVGGRFALYRIRHHWFLLRLSAGSGYASLLRARGGRRIVAASLTSAGLFFLYRPSRKHERLAYVPSARLRSTP